MKQGRVDETPETGRKRGGKIGYALENH